MIRAKIVMILLWERKEVKVHLDRGENHHNGGINRPRGRERKNIEESQKRYQ